MLNGDAHLSTRRDGELRIWPLRIVNESKRWEA